MINGLTPRQLNFVNAYVKNKGNRVAAVKEAGFASTDGSAAVIASRLLKNVNVMEKINEESRLASEAVKLDKELVMRELSRIITMGKKDSDRIAAIKSFETEETWTIQKGKKGILPDHIVKKDVDELEKKITFAKMKLTDIHAEELDINALLNFGRVFIRTVEYAWSEAPTEYKLELQRLIFPEGLKYHYKGFSNSRLSPAFAIINDFASKKSNAVSLDGLEPSTTSLRGRCSTFELQARTYPSIIR